MRYIKLVWLWLEGGDGGAVSRAPEIQDALGVAGVEELAANLTELVESPADGDKPEDPE